MITSSDSSYEPLLALLQQRPDLFQLFDPARYNRLFKFAPEALFKDGESNFIKVENQLYRFDWETVEEFGISEFEKEP